MFSLLRFICGILSVGFAASLAGCGGGGSGSGGNTNTQPPSSGSYAFILKPIGSTSSPTYGISLVHPSATGVEFRIEPETSAISDLKVVSSATVTAATATVSNIQPYALLYIIGGNVRRLPLVANGTVPSTLVKKSSSTNACKFIVDGNDYATPDNSRYIVSTAGADGQCGTADDGQSEVTLDSTGGVTVTQKAASGGIQVIGMLRDPGTLAPGVWVEGNNFMYWSTPTMLSLRINNDPLLTRVVEQSSSTAVAEYNNQLTVLNYGGPSVFTGIETVLDSTITAGSGWKSIGYDSSNFYVYRNSGSTTSSNWTVLKISRTAPAATKLAGGVGLIQTASMGSNILYATVSGATGNSLLTINKTTPGVPQVFENTATSILSTVLTSNSGVHQLWQISGINSTTPTYTISIIDESGATLYTAAGGFPLAMPDAGAVNLNKSENRSRFVFASGYGVRAFGDAPLILYDATTKAATTLGLLPGATDFGSTPIYASLTASSADFIAGFATNITSNSLQNAGAKVFSVNLATLSNLKYTTSTQ